jgi:AcrR family transcriptional regulator
MKPGATTRPSASMTSPASGDATDLRIDPMPPIRVPIIPLASLMGVSRCRTNLYYYYPSKASVLRSMMTSIVQDLLTTLNDAAAASGDTPAQRLEALVRATVLFHCRRQAEAFVGRSELRSLDPADRPDVIALYDRVTDVFRVVIDEGVRQGEFRCPYRSEAVHAILTMCNGVSTWYRKGGRLSPEELAARHVALTLQMLGCAAD